MSFRNKKRNQELKLSFLMKLIFTSHVKNITRKKLYSKLIKECQLVISNICAAKSKFLKKEKYYAPTMKLKLRIFMMSKTLLKKLMINFEIILLIDFIT